MNGKTAKKIRKASKALLSKGIIPQAKAAANRVKRDYNLKKPNERFNFKVALDNLPHHIATMENNLNKNPENLS